MPKSFSTIIAMLFFGQLFAQNAVNPGTAANSGYNFDFERTASDGALPDLWVHFNQAKGYHAEATSETVHSGNQALYVTRINEDADPFASIVNTLPAKYAGKEIEFKAWLKYEDVKKYTGLLINMDDANGQSVAFRSMASQKIRGTKDWALYSIKAHIPETAQKIYVACILAGPGKLWMDDAQVLIDGIGISKATLKPNYNPDPPKYGNNTFAGGKMRIKDAEIYYETYGSGEPLLLLHGNSQSIRSFSYQIDDLSQKFKVIAVDSRGQGKSTDETTGALSYDLFADDMRQLMDSLRIKKANILGWGDGGNTGLVMAIKYPQYVNKLAIIGANLFSSNEAVTDTMLKEVKAGLERLKTRTDDYSKMETRLFTLLLTEPHITFDQLKTIRSPVLVMAGEHDVIKESHTHDIAAAIPQSQLLIFKGLSHTAPVEDPKQFNNAVLQFMTK